MFDCAFSVLVTYCILTLVGEVFHGAFGDGIPPAVPEFGDPMPRIRTEGDHVG